MEGGQNGRAMYTAWVLTPNVLNAYRCTGLQWENTTVKIQQVPCELHSLQTLSNDCIKAGIYHQALNKYVKSSKQNGGKSINQISSL